MVKAAKPRIGSHLACVVTSSFHRSIVRCGFLKRNMGAILVVVGHVLLDEPTEMLLVERDHVVHHVSACAADPPFGDTVLPGALDAAAQYAWPSRTKELDDILPEFGIAIKDDIALRERIGEPATTVLRGQLLSLVRTEESSR